MKPSIVIVDYDPQWPAMYAAERVRILAAAGAALAAVEHIGSTSVPGLGAKPCIDIMAAVRCLEEVPPLIEPLAGIGYEYRPQGEAFIPERRYFRKGPAENPHDYHLHIVEQANDFWRRHLLFRDYLRAHPGAAAAYNRLKRRLAAEYGSDRQGYNEAKTEFITSIEAKAGV